jgi:hypothetical protein
VTHLSDLSAPSTSQDALDRERTLRVKSVPGARRWRCQSTARIRYCLTALRAAAGAGLRRATEPTWGRRNVSVQ